MLARRTGPLFKLLFQHKLPSFFSLFFFFLGLSSFIFHLFLPSLFTPPPPVITVHFSPWTFHGLRIVSLRCDSPFSSLPSSPARQALCVYLRNAHVDTTTTDYKPSYHLRDASTEVIHLDPFHGNLYPSPPRLLLPFPRFRSRAHCNENQLLISRRRSSLSYAEPRSSFL